MRVQSTPVRNLPNRLGPLLRAWRSARGVSQLDLAFRSGLSARHVSFVETGRAQPSRQALLAMAEALEMPLRERNELLEAGGYARVYRETPLQSGEMGHVREILRFILDRHEPYGAVALDRHWNIVSSNAAAARSLPVFSDASLWHDTPVNLLRLIFHPLGVRRFILNWEEVSGHLLRRAHRELAGFAADEMGAALLEELHRYPDVPRRPAVPPPSSTTDLVVPVHLRKDGVDIRTFSTIMTLGTPQDVTLQELRIETFFPADAASDQAIRAMAGSAAG